MRRYTLPGSYRPRLWLICYELLRKFDLELASRALRDGVDWIRAVARFNVPECGPVAAWQADQAACRD